jgi:hypothetical protein
VSKGSYAQKRPLANLSHSGFLEIFRVACPGHVGARINPLTRFSQAGMQMPQAITSVEQSVAQTSDVSENELMEHPGRGRAVLQRESRRE